MNQCNDDDEILCIKETLENILLAQKQAEQEECKSCETSCINSIKQLLNSTFIHSKNTIPFILYCNSCEPFKVEGTTTFFDHCSNKQRFFCFTTFIFRIKGLKNDCALLELLKFECNEECISHNSECCEKCICSPSCQLHLQDVDDLIPTGVCIKVDLSCFCAIQCLPAVCI